MATRTISDAGGNWGDLTTWVEGAVPTTSDDVVAQSDGTSGNLTVNVYAYCKSLDFSNYTGTFNINIPTSLKVLQVTGSIKFVSNMSFNNYTNNLLWLIGSGSITTAGKNMGTMYISSSNVGIPGTWDLQDDLLGEGILFIYEPTFNSNNHNITVSGLNAQSGVDHNPTGNFGTSIITCQNFIWENGILDLSNTIVIINGIYVSYGIGIFMTTVSECKTLRITGNINDTYLIGGNNTFNNLELATVPLSKTIWFMPGTTQTIIDTFVTTGNVTNTVTITGFDMENFGIFTLHKDSGVVGCDYLDLSYSTAEGGAIWNAGSHSINSGNNTGWNFVTINIKKYCGVTYENIKKASNVTIENVKKIIGVS